MNYLVVIHYIVVEKNTFSEALNVNRMVQATSLEEAIGKAYLLFFAENNENYFIKQIVASKA